MAAPPLLEKNDGGIVVALVLLMAALSAVFFSAVMLYAGATEGSEKKEKRVPAKRLAKLLSGWANVGNAVAHVLLVTAELADPERYRVHFPDDFAAALPWGPLILAVINGLVGLNSLKGAGGITLALGWNSFVAVLGSVVPIVWPKFINVGMSTWPYLAIFLWLGIFAFESTAFFFTAVAFALRNI
eukprot:TRINITY_DN17876_c0_g1_i1.p2 TRINITY_DN17876_c0_g1~~TRINITY_DN17876_c0_g1_i1.p2  ORF type:complete len:186 (+),score=45.63 TRINITY_DN17876_c0_g1_i1:43-600(+)